MARAITVIFGVILLVQGCATYPNAMDVQQCKAGRTLVCEQRMGQIEQCGCRDKHDMRDILEPSQH